MADQAQKSTNQWMLLLTIAGLVLALIGTAQVPEVRNITCNQINVLCPSRQNIIELGALDSRISQTYNISSLVIQSGWKWLVMTVADERHKAGSFDTQQMISYFDAPCLDSSEFYRVMKANPSPPVVWQDISLVKTDGKMSGNVDDRSDREILFYLISKSANNTALKRNDHLEIKVVVHRNDERYAEKNYHIVLNQGYDEASFFCTIGSYPPGQYELDFTFRRDLGAEDQSQKIELQIR